jgi:glyoxylate/hydroxypyruvate reductase
MKTRIVVALPPGALAKWAERLRAALPDADITTREADRDTADSTPTPADYALLWRPHPSFFHEQKQLKAIFNLGAGIDALAAMPQFPRSVPLIRLEDAGMARPMAQYALAGRAPVRRSVRRVRQEPGEQKWAPRRPRAPDEMEVGVLGLGAIGSVVARTIADQGFRVRGFLANTAHAGRGAGIRRRRRTGALLHRGPRADQCVAAHPGDAGNPPA